MNEVLREYDIACLEEAIQESVDSVENGNHPFGAVLADAQGKIVLRAQNSVETTGDVTGHAETNLMRLASTRFSREFLEQCTIYSSAEPCAMCSGAIHWAGVKRLVYGLSEEKLYEMTGDDPSNETLQLPCREVFSHSRRNIEVTGPLLENEAAEPHRGFWSK